MEQKRISGQDLGNPNPPSITEVPHEGHKADSDSWRRTRNKDYLKKRSRQLITKGSTDKALLDIVRPKRSI